MRCPSSGVSCHVDVPFFFVGEVRRYMCKARPPVQSHPEAARRREGASERACIKLHTAREQSVIKPGAAPADGRERINGSVKAKETGRKKAERGDKWRLGLVFHPSILFSGQGACCLLTRPRALPSPRVVEAQSFWPASAPTNPPARENNRPPCLPAQHSPYFSEPHCLPTYFSLLLFFSFLIPPSLPLLLCHGPPSLSLIFPLLQPLSHSPSPPVTVRFLSVGTDYLFTHSVLIRLARPTLASEHRTDCRPTCPSLRPRPPRPRPRPSRTAPPTTSRSGAMASGMPPRCTSPTRP